MASLDKIYRRLDKLHQAQQPKNKMDYYRLALALGGLIIIIGYTIAVISGMSTATELLDRAFWIVLGVFFGGTKAAQIIAGRINNAKS